MMDVPDTAPLYYLRTFHTVAAQRSYTGAARALHLSQPAVSAHIRALERHYGGPLFQVRHRRVSLTAEGEALHAYTERIFNLLNDAERAVAATRGLERGRLVVAASTTVGVYLLPAILRRYADSYPGVHVSLLVGTTAQAVGYVRAEQAPIALVEAAVDHPDLDVRPFGHDDVVLAVPPAHAWAARAAVTPDDLRPVPLLRREASAGSRAFVDHALARAGVRVETAMEMGSWEALKQAVMAGLGIAFVPRMAVVRELDAGALVAVSTPDVDLRRTLFRVSPRAARLPPPVEALVDMLHQPEAPN
jgi:DNA-binding transcriptional LysR family regulator